MKRKFKYLPVLFLIVFSAMQPIAGQSVRKAVAFFRLPAVNVLTVKAMQNDSPVQLEEIEVLTDETGKMPIFNWHLKNNSSKTVKRFVVALKYRTNIEQWRKFMNNNEYDIGTNEKNDLIKPGDAYREYDYSNSALLPKDKLNELFTFNKDSGDNAFIIVYGMIKKVVFDDGSVYEESNKIFDEF